MVVASFRLSTNHHLIVCRNFICTPNGVHTTSVCCPYVPQLGYIRPSKGRVRAVRLCAVWGTGSVSFDIGVVVT